MTNTFIRTKKTHDSSPNIDYGMIQLAKIKSTKDLSHSGKLRVWLVNSNTNENIEENWITVQYGTPFGGTTNPSDVNRQATESYEGTQKSYGFFAVPPDINNHVLVAFANGNSSEGYWISSVYKDSLTHMVPGLGSNKSYDGTTTGPVAEMNIYSKQPTTHGSNPTRPSYSPLSNGLSSQGLTNDSLRGAGTASAWRDESPSVVGILSPGGNQFIMDDKAGSRMIRIRTQSGAQILVSEDDGCIYAITKSGDAWIELSNNGNVDIYSGKNISIYSMENLNLTAKKNINIQSEEGLINISAKNDLTLQSTNARTNLSGQTDLNIQARNGKLYLSSKNEARVESKDKSVEFKSPEIEKHDTPGSVTTSLIEAPVTAAAGNPDRKPTHEPFVR